MRLVPFTHRGSFWRFDGEIFVRKGVRFLSWLHQQLSLAHFKINNGIGFAMFHQQGIKTTSKFLKQSLSGMGSVCVAKINIALLFWRQRGSYTWVCCRSVWHVSSGKGGRWTSSPLTSSRIQRSGKAQRPPILSCMQMFS